MPDTHSIEKPTSPAEHSADTGSLGALALGDVVTDNPTDSELTREQKLGLAKQWLDTPGILQARETESMPANASFEVALLAQKEIDLQLEDGFLDDDFYDYNFARNAAVEASEELDFEIVELARRDWPFQVQLNGLHDRFKQVPAEQISAYLSVPGDGYEMKALRIRNIIGDNAPELLTADVQAVLDPSVSPWRASSAHAAILLRNKSHKNINSMQVDRIPTYLPTSDRLEFTSTDAGALKPVSEMTDDELALYCKPDAAADVKDRGYARFIELNQTARETLLTQRLFETITKSNSPDAKAAASARNRALEQEPVLQQGDLVHATGDAETFGLILTNGLKCGESILSNSRSIIKYPFTVSFLEVTDKIAKPETMPERLNEIRNAPYGPINLVLHRDESSMEVVKGADSGVAHQRQIFGGVPATEITSVVIREEVAAEHTASDVINAIVKHGMFIPVFSGTTGEPLLTSEQYDQLMLK